MPLKKVKRPVKPKPPLAPRKPKKTTWRPNDIILYNNEDLSSILEKGFPGIPLKNIRVELRQGSASHRCNYCNRASPRLDVVHYVLTSSEECTNPQYTRDLHRYNQALERFGPIKREYEEALAIYTEQLKEWQEYQKELKAEVTRRKISKLKCELSDLTT